MTPKHMKRRFQGPAAGRRRWRDGVGARVLIIALAGALSFGLYRWAGRHDPLPVWITLPPGASVEASRYELEPRPDRLQGGPAYYLQVRFEADPQTAASQMEASVVGFAWEQARRRPTDSTDMVRRAQWPSWVRERVHSAKDFRGGLTRSASSASGTLHLYAWPVDGGSIVELIEETDLSLAEM